MVLTQQCHQKVTDLLGEFTDVFGCFGPAPARMTPFRVDLIECARPISQPPCRISATKSAWAQEIKRWESDTTELYLSHSGLAFLRLFVSPSTSRSLVSPAPVLGMLFVVSSHVFLCTVLGTVLDNEGVVEFASSLVVKAARILEVVLKADAEAFERARAAFMEKAKGRRSYEPGEYVVVYCGPSLVAEKQNEVIYSVQELKSDRMSLFISITFASFSLAPWNSAV